MSISSASTKCALPSTSSSTVSTIIGCIFEVGGQHVSSRLPWRALSWPSRLPSWLQFLRSSPYMDKGPSPSGTRKPQCTTVHQGLIGDIRLPSPLSSSTASCCVLWSGYGPPSVSRLSHRLTRSAACSTISLRRFPFAVKTFFRPQPPSSQNPSLPPLSRCGLHHLHWISDPGVANNGCIAMAHVRQRGVSLVQP